MRRWLRNKLVSLQGARQQRKIDAETRLKARYHVFRSLLASNNRAVDCLSEVAILLRLEGESGGLSSLIQTLIEETAEMIGRLDHLTGGKYSGLWTTHEAVVTGIKIRLDKLARPNHVSFLLFLAQIHDGLRAMTGNKAAALAALRKNGLRVPDGFVVTLAGCRHFLDHGGLSLELAHLLAKGGYQSQGSISAKAARRAQDIIRQAEIPDDLIAEITTAAQEFFDRNAALAVRSSSASEDGSQHSFAGQFSSVLNVRDTVQFLAAFKEVVASNFNVRSLTYRINAGFDPLRFDMAVLCLEMVNARAAGVLLTRSPQEPESDLMLISAVPGQGEAAVSGSAAADLYHVHPDGRVDWQRSTIAEKEKFLVSSPKGGLIWKEVPVEKRLQPVLDTEELRTLAAWGQELEKHEGGPLDLEWAVDAAGLPVILQMRPMTTMGTHGDDGGEQASSPPLIQGIMASCGRASGRVLLVKNLRDLETLPQEPLVLVMHQSFVEVVAILDRVAAVLVDLGSPADHLACVAREQGLPLICGLRDVGRLLSVGQWLTVDGSNGAVYAASDTEQAAALKIWEQRPVQGPIRNIPPLPPLRQELQEMITALHLTDAYGPTFSIMECRSLHDIIRFVHEKGVLAMFDAGDSLLEDNFGAVYVLESPVPFFLNVIDLGGGLALQDGKRCRKIMPELVVSRPFRALWQGITSSGLHWGPPPGGAPMGAVVSSFLTDQKSERPIGLPNFAMVSRDYCNLNARMDFHFIMIDTVCGLAARSNHIKFRFKGGGTSLERRCRRALCIGTIFEHYGFAVDVRDDLVNAALQGAVPEVIEEKLVMVGRILGFTRLLDAFMKDDRMIAKVVEAFIVGNYGLSGIV